MVTDFLAVEPEDTLGEVAERMQRQDTGSALVTESGRLIGILTSRDLVRAFAGRIHSSEARVREWMTAEPISTRPTRSLTAALRLMHGHAIHHLPVVVNERPVGVVGMRNLAGGSSSGSRAPTSVWASSRPALCEPRARSRAPRAPARRPRRTRRGNRAARRPGRGPPRSPHPHRR